MADHIVIDSRDAYREALDLIVAGEGPIAVDAERASGFRYSQRAYLIQMFRRGSGTFLFDPPAIGRFDELNEAIAGDEWVLHAATQDLTCLREVGLDPVSIFDTELAARLLGMPRVGLGTVVEELLGIHLAKEHSAADWSTRPLPEPWLDYAALDVELLPDLRDAIAGLLVEAGKTDIARQEFADELTRELVVPRHEPWRRLSGIHSIRGLRNLAVARELWLSRDALAQQLDVAPGRLVPDASLTAAAKAMPDSKRALAAMREFTGRASRTELDRWWGAIEAGRSTDDLPVLRGTGESLPPPRAWADRNPEADARLKAARAALTTLAEELSLPLENLLTPDTLRRVAWTPPAEVTPSTVADALAKHGARRWQIEATSQAIAQAFVESTQTPRDASEAAS
ncbi:HRDC domain-containing protein [Leifsonia shinshuensis]|uniref:Ribonuclease D n=1 Tax=Leifsonia shinshuensis TaxID=150026 RepID=A0A7G6Y6A0_9MICO|nr:HRDC domain-containing protein [Leifsonia shinshuensis]QNE34015.1 ribonuclease D [Leifsonia shinshuensis]